MWAEDSDEEEVTGKTSFSKKKPKNYTAPVNFISGGVQQAGKKKEKEGTKEDNSEDEEIQQIEQGRTRTCIEKK